MDGEELVTGWTDPIWRDPEAEEVDRGGHEAALFDLETEVGLAQEREDLVQGVEEASWGGAEHYNVVQVSDDVGEVGEEEVGDRREGLRS